MVYDAVLMEVFRSRLDAVAEEMQNALLKSAYSIILKEGGDCSCAVFSPSGEEIVSEAIANPGHLAAFVPAVRHIIYDFPPSTMSDGDIYLLNDPYSGGTHLPDLIIVVPVFYDTALVAYACVLAHHQDVGGKNPGSMVPDATDIYQEGLAIPPSRLYHRGIPNDTLMNIMSRNVRIPDQLFGDLRAQIAAAKTAIGRLRELIDRYGLETFHEMTEALLNHAEQLTRQQLDLIPDGVYEFSDFLDNDGRDFDRRLRIQVRIVVSGSDISFDFTGTSAQSVGPANMAPGGMLGPVAFAIRALTGGSIPSNGGCFRPITLTVPSGTLLEPLRPAPLSIRYQTQKRCVDAILGALAPVLPNRIPAAPSGNDLCVSIGGTDPATGGSYVYMECDSGGTGATWHDDGVDLLPCDLGNAMNIPAEAAEIEYPIRIWAQQPRVDSGGPGEFRGGLGIVRVIELLRGSAIASMRSDRHCTQPWGLRGGLAGARWSAVIDRAKDGLTVLPGRYSFRLEAGDRLIVMSGGGGGYGYPIDRDEQAVMSDVHDGRVSLEVARKIYGVALNEDRSIDVHETARLRSEYRSRARSEDGIFDRGSDGLASIGDLQDDLKLVSIISLDPDSKNSPPPLPLEGSTDSGPVKQSPCAGC